jgi:hypothetical protein
LRLYQYLNVIAPKFERFAYSGDVDKFRQRQKMFRTDDLVRAEIVQRPWTDRRRDPFLGTALIAERTIRSIQQEFARAW